MSSGNLDFEQFRTFLEKACGILLGSNKQYLVSSRLNKLMEQNGIKTLGELVQRMQSQPRGGLREQVVDAMTTNETLWFRDTYPFEVLKSRVLPELIKAYPSQRLRIWSAACSSGQEPYSLSMSIDEFERTNLGQLKAGVQIVATDLSPSMLSNCKSGEYDSLAMGRGLSQERLQRFFDPRGPGRWQAGHRTRRPRCGPRGRCSRPRRWFLRDQGMRPRTLATKRVQKSHVRRPSSDKP